MGVGELLERDHDRLCAAAEIDAQLLAADIAEGGVAVALAECALAGGVGAEVELDGSIEALFGEGPGGFLISAAPGSLDALTGAVPLIRIGTVGGEMLRISAGAHSIAVTLGQLVEAHSAFAELFA